MIPPTAFVTPFTVATQRDAYYSSSTTNIVDVRRGIINCSVGGLFLSSNGSDVDDSIAQPAACLSSYLPSGEENELLATLRNAGYRTVGNNADEPRNVFRYHFIKATGMLKLVGGPGVEDDASYDSAFFNAPKWIPVVRGEENVLVANGWSFLDPDESDPLSAFDAANAEGLYHPKWGNNRRESKPSSLSSLGYDLTPMSSEEVLAEAERSVTADSRSVMLDGGTDKYGTKRTNNVFDFSGSAGQADIKCGIFACAIGGLPLFSSVDLSPTTASAGWLSFVRPIAQDHVRCVDPEDSSADQRIEVICAKSGCHLGHYFKGEGYCINASALNFFGARVAGDEGGAPETVGNVRTMDKILKPISWHRIMSYDVNRSEDMLRSILLRPGLAETVALGGGCFWHFEFAIRRLPGIISTEAGYAGGTTMHPTYEEVCKKNTHHAEVVKVAFDPESCPPEKLFGCFLAMHDPTMGRAHGKRAKETGQYRSCIFVTSDDMKTHATKALEDCRAQLKRELSTEIHLMRGKGKTQLGTDDWFWTAEERHQRRDERVKNRGPDKTSTLSIPDWLLEYGRRSDSIWGSSESMIADDPRDDGMARMMI